MMNVDNLESCCALFLLMENAASRKYRKGLEVKLTLTLVKERISRGFTSSTLHCKKMNIPFRIIGTFENFSLRMQKDIGTF